MREVLYAVWLISVTVGIASEIGLWVSALVLLLLLWRLFLLRRIFEHFNTLFEKNC